MTAPVDGGDNQGATIAFLSRPETYGLRDKTVELVATHCSLVFLAGEHAYKLKRAIRYVSLDYTTQDLRRAACEAEVRLNRRTAPSLYLGVRSINREAGGSLAFDGAGPPVDHVVHMRRFALPDLFDHMCNEDRLTTELIRSLGETVARFHRDAEVTPGCGGSNAIRRVIADNSRELANVATELDGAAVGRLIGLSVEALDAVTPLLDQRRAQGRVRRCHGDLRLANICLYGGRPILFDCIEFSDEISCIDVLYDLAFLLMDLELAGRCDLANTVFNTYLDLAQETDGLRTLPLFLALRSATRSYALAGAARRRSDPAGVARLLVLARHHIEAGIRFLRQSNPMFILMKCDERCAPDWTMAFAASAPPRPGARVLMLSRCEQDEWRGAEETVAAGCSVLVRGCFTPDAERRSIALAGRVNAPLIALRADGDNGRSSALWRTVRSEADALRSLSSVLSADARARRAVIPRVV